MVGYVRSLGKVHKSDPLFQVSKNVVLKKSYFIDALKMSLIELGLNPHLYGGHSFRSGSATSASIKGFNEWELKLLGRWESNVYTIYLRKPELVASFAQRLI